MPEILVGRDADDLDKYGDEGMGVIARHIVGEKQEMHLANRVKLDLTRPHVVTVFGKRGQGKSYTMGTVAEEIMRLGETIRNNLAAVIIDTMGIYWSMKQPNERDAQLLADWDLKPKGFDVKILIPSGLTEAYEKKEIPFDGTFSMKPRDLDFGAWSLTFNITLDTEVGILLESVVKKALESDENFSIRDLIKLVDEEDAPDLAKKALKSRFLLAEDWGIFSTEGSDLEDIVIPGTTTIIDISQMALASGGWSVRSLVVALLGRRILEERMRVRRLEENETVTFDSGKKHMPITWMFVDEAHQFLPADEVVPSSQPLLQWIKIGREPGVSLVLATQMPFKLHQEAISQADIVISHRLTSHKDIQALENVMQSYLKYNIADYFDALPRVKGAALILDDNSERLYPVRMRPRMSWHGGGSPIAIKESQG